ncbi:hypothetical protein V8B97DRAFT_1398028 [Scleroderma yunnanense]
MTSHPKPLQASLAGIGVSLSVHSLLIFNGSVLGVSGLLHRSVRGDSEAAIGVLGLVLSGIIAGYLEPSGPLVLSTSFPSTILAGLLVGVGTRLANGCTSGHMIAGLSRFSRRSFVATMSFFSTAVIVTQIFHRENLPLSVDADWSLGGRTGHIHALITALAPLLLAVPRSNIFAKTWLPFSYKLLPRLNAFARSPLRSITCLLTSFAFGISLSLGNMVDPKRVLAFLVLPVSRTFDPTLAFLAGSALPLSIVLYRYARPDHPHLGEKWAIPSNTKIDARLVCGSIAFGIGWGVCGICPPSGCYQ